MGSTNFEIRLSGFTTGKTQEEINAVLRAFEKQFIKEQLIQDGNGKVHSVTGVALELVDLSNEEDDDDEDN